jgi:hypothetical protein
LFETPDQERALILSYLLDSIFYVNQKLYKNELKGNMMEVVENEINKFLDMIK